LKRPWLLPPAVERVDPPCRNRAVIFVLSSATEFCDGGFGGFKVLCPNRYRAVLSQPTARSGRIFDHFQVRKALLISPFNPKSGPDDMSLLFADHRDKLVEAVRSQIKDALASGAFPPKLERVRRFGIVSYDRAQIRNGGVCFFVIALIKPSSSR
jgi:hypothetical protein